MIDKVKDDVTDTLEDARDKVEEVIVDPIKEKMESFGDKLTVFMGKYGLYTLGAIGVLVFLTILANLI